MSPHSSTEREFPGLGFLLDAGAPATKESLEARCCRLSLGRTSSHPGSAFPVGCLHGEGERKRELRWFPWQQQGRACCLGDGEEREAVSLRVSAPHPSSHRRRSHPGLPGLRTRQAMTTILQVMVSVEATGPESLSGCRHTWLGAH